MKKNNLIDQRIGIFRKWCHDKGLQQKEHQISGMKFCLKREFTASSFGINGGFVFDEMGLGKTTLMLGCILTNYGFVDFCGERCRNTLIVVPKALVSQWVEVMRKLFNKKIKINIFHGQKCKGVTATDLATNPITITTYGMVARDVITSTQWKRVVFDEAHHLRNPRSKKHTACSLVKAKIKWFLSGTPINNRMNDIDSLCKILLGKKGSVVYRNRYDEVVSKHILKRTKKSVGIKLPPVNTTIINVDWKYPEEKKLAIQLHKKINFSNIISDVAEGDIIRDMTKTQLGCFIRARQICILPSPIIKTIKNKRKLIYEMSGGHDDGLGGHDEGLGGSHRSSKLNAVISHILNNPGRKKLVFCHYLDEIDYIYKYFKSIGVSIGKITGKVNDKEKQDLFSPPIKFGVFSSLSKTYNSLNSDIFGIISEFICPTILLVQIQTGCEGLNLQHFKDVYFTSPHWNPTVEDQAVARSHRIGQTNNVNVYKFIMGDLYADKVDPVDQVDIGNTMDKYCRHIQNKKRELIECLDKYETDKVGSYLLN